ncbi:kinase-like domain-containing protein [Thamnocephalis sphaerospora]|uniref:Kinase-like domain-containing protein n=1 Tax=Thamnocephalis sphaerospora TaxID=78915 RepID=A0A4P9XS18_9FUNG|nr:kinase-like domain-containing protein [Thamnocephalis sphaerospora]|eukprot:RKP08752.1 kinase-like domain-containing protein [Thamnocephalis sphaerospora]
MCAFSARRLLAIAITVLLSNDLSYASPTQPSASSSSGASLWASGQSALLPSYDATLSAGDTEWPNQPGLYVAKWLPEESNGMRTAIVDYSGVQALLKCTRNAYQHNSEVKALNALRGTSLSNETLPFPEVLDTFQTDNEYHCLVLDMIDGHSLREYMPMVPHYQKDVVVAKIANQLASDFIHGNITPDTVYLRSDDEGALKLVLTGFEGSQARDDFPQEPTVKPKGYTPPEDFVEPKAYRRSRDAWMFGATLYFMTNGHPPYGFAYSQSSGKMHPVSEEELQETMVQVATTGKNSYLPIQTESNDLLYEMEGLLEPKPGRRLEADSLAFSDSLEAAEKMSMKNSLWERWDHLKSMLPIIGTPSWQVEPPPRTRVEDNSTRYKTP